VSININWLCVPWSTIECIQKELFSKTLSASICRFLLKFFQRRFSLRWYCAMGWVYTLLLLSNSSRIGYNGVVDHSIISALCICVNWPGQRFSWVRPSGVHGFQVWVQLQVKKFTVQRNERALTYYKYSPFTYRLFNGTHLQGRSQKFVLGV